MGEGNVDEGIEGKKTDQFIWQLRVGRMESIETFDL